jgi:hypothetical protein
LKQIYFYELWDSKQTVHALALTSNECYASNTIQVVTQFGAKNQGYLNLKSSLVKVFNTPEQQMIWGGE